MTRNAFFLPYLALLSTLGFLATDMYLPAFSLMQHDFATEAGTISASLSIFLAGFACAQLIWGPLSDRIGRKPVLLAGLSIFAVGCAGMLWVQDTELMLILRFLQAVGVCAAAVSWQALVVDRYPPHQSHKVFATIMPLVALSPALAPLIGAWLLSHFSWRAIFLTLMVISLLLLVPTLLLKNKRHASDERPAQPGFFTLLRSAVYSGNVLIYAACSASFFAWLTGSPFILHDMGLTPGDIGLSYIPQTIAFLIGGYSCRAALNRTTGDRLLPWLLALYAVSIVTLFAVAMSSQPTLTMLLIPFCGMAMANGAIYPIVVASALSPFPQATGKAAALQNMLQLGLCFIASLAVSHWLAAPLMTTSFAMLFTVFLALIGFFWQRSAAVTQAAVAHS